VGGVTAILEEPVPGRDGDVRGGLGEHGQVVPGYAVQEGWVARVAAVTSIMVITACFSSK
jgi:hypothetical protein